MLLIWIIGVLNAITFRNGFLLLFVGFYFCLYMLRELLKLALLLWSLDNVLLFDLNCSLLDYYRLNLLCYSRLFLWFDILSLYSYGLQILELILLIRRSLKMIVICFNASIDHYSLVSWNSDYFLKLRWQLWLSFLLMESMIKDTRDRKSRSFGSIMVDIYTS